MPKLKDGNQERPAAVPCEHVRRPKTKLTKAGKIRGRKVFDPTGLAADGIADMGDDYPPRPMRVNRTLSIVHSVLARRHGKTISEQAHGIVDVVYPKIDRTPANLDAVERWLRDPTRSNPPFSERPKQRKKRQRKANDGADKPPLVPYAGRDKKA